MRVLLYIRELTNTFVFILYMERKKDLTVFGPFGLGPYKIFGPYILDPTMIVYILTLPLTPLFHFNGMREYEKKFIF